MKIKVTVNFIGKIWMPSVTCAHSFTLSERDNSRFTEPFDLSDDADCLAFAEHFLYGEKSGDFQSVTDYEVVRETSETTDNGNPKNRLIHTTSKFDTLRTWESEENECVYSDCVCGD